MLKILRIAVIASSLTLALPASAGLLQGGHMCTNHAGHTGMTTANNGLSSSNFTFFPTPTAWDPGVNTGRVGGHPAPGGATWSIMGAGLVDVSTFDGGHVGATQAITSLGVAGWGVAQYASMINAALDIWAAASGFTNLGQVADSGTNAGAAGAAGDIRVAAWEIGASNVLAHAYQPGTEAIFGPGGSIAGDVHMDVNRNWTDNAADTTGNGQFDIFTVMLHELGHALGLGHTNVAGSVMEPVYAGSRRTLGADDIAGIQALYGAPAARVSEPATLWLFGVGLLALGWARRRA